MNLNKIIINIGLVLFFIMLISACKTQNSSTSSNHKHPANKLINESSPYLLQHAYNPVDWYPWGDEALRKAQDENKLILISVGYSACHWCHVMEHESFEDSLVADIMNKHFISIKVDREERPDIDDVYMTACHISSGRSCGWPLNAMALPDGRPFWAGTYFPKEEWMDALNYFIKLYSEDPNKIEVSADNITNNIQNSETIQLNTNEAAFKQEDINQIVENFIKNIDMKRGGKKGPPKFPMPNNYEFLLQHYYHSGNEQALQAVTATLDNMAKGGIYDQIGGGFARYSVDDIWKAPHFEKMLYDNAQLVSLYSKAYQVTKNPLYKEIVFETLDYIKREMTDKTGAFYSSLDADSEGEEGKFYVWDKSEIKEVLGEGNDFDIYCEYYNIKEKGNWEHKNILFITKKKKDVADKYKVSVEELETSIKASDDKLFKAREKRIRPGLDDKALTAWNALMLKGYIDAYRVFNKPEYLEAALKNGNFLKEKAMSKEFRLNRNYKDGKSVINAFLDDYALTIEGFIALYQATFDEEWLKVAKALTNYTIENFYDKNSGMFYYTSKKDKKLIARKMETSDNVIPGSNSTMAKNLYVLSLYFYDYDYLTKARTMVNNMLENIKYHSQPSFYSNWCSVLNHLVNPPYEVAILGENFAQKRKALDQRYLPNVIFMGGKQEGSLELLKDKLIEGDTRIYVCQNKVCKLPTPEPAQAFKLILK